MAALIWVELMNVVFRGVPVHFTTAPETNPLPLTVIRKYGPPASIKLGEALVMNGTGASAAIAQRTRQKHRMCGLIRPSESNWNGIAAVRAHAGQRVRTRRRHHSTEYAWSHEYRDSSIEILPFPQR